MSGWKVGKENLMAVKSRVKLWELLVLVRLSAGGKTVKWI